MVLKDPSLKAYPDFEELQIEDLALFKEAFAATAPRISEFTFTNLYAWREAYKLKVCLLDDFIILRCESEPKMRFFEPVGRGDKKNTMEKIFSDFKAAFMRIPEETMAFFAKDSRFGIEPDMDNFDYLYKTEDLTGLKGRKYDGKRNQINKFRSNYAYEYMPLSFANAEVCLEFEERWCTIKNCDGLEGLSNERRAIRQMIANFSDFELNGGAIKIQGDISAVALAQKLNSDTLVMHALKANPNIAGLYQTMLQEFLFREAAGFTYVNLEQDLGQPGLRKAKQSYHPAEIIKKYTLKSTN